MKFLAVILALAVTPALAQQARAPTYAELQGMAQALGSQVDALRNMHMQAEAKVGALAEENAALKKQIEELKKPAADQNK